MAGQWPGDAWPQAEAKALWPRFRALLPKVGIVPLAEIRTDDGQPAWGIELRAARLDGRLTVNLANCLRTPQRVRLRVAGKPVAATDLLALRKLPALFEIPSLQPILLAAD